MKKVFVFSIALLMALTGQSCKKCAECTQTITQTSSVPAYPVLQTVTTNLGKQCGQDLKDLQGKGTTSSVATVPYLDPVTLQIITVTITTTTKITCK